MRRPESITAGIRRACLELEMRHPEAPSLRLPGPVGGEGTTTVTCRSRQTPAGTTGAGLVRRHPDRFDLWRWSRMALGMPGVLLGWSPLIRNKVRKQAADGLAAFRSKAGRA